MRTGLDTIENEFGKSFNLEQYVNDQNSTIGIDSEIIDFPAPGIPIQNLIYYPLAC